MSFMGAAMELTLRVIISTALEEFVVLAAENCRSPKAISAAVEDHSCSHTQNCICGASKHREATHCKSCADHLCSIRK